MPTQTCLRATLVITCIWSLVFPSNSSAHTVPRNACEGIFHRETMPLSIAAYLDEILTGRLTVLDYRKLSTQVDLDELIEPIGSSIWEGGLDPKLASGVHRILAARQMNLGVSALFVAINVPLATLVGANVGTDPASSLVIGGGFLATVVPLQIGFSLAAFPKRVRLMWAQLKELYAFRAPDAKKFYERVWDLGPTPQVLRFPFYLFPDDNSSIETAIVQAGAQRTIRVIRSSASLVLNPLHELTQPTIAASLDVIVVPSNDFGHQIFYMALTTPRGNDTEAALHSFIRHNPKAINHNADLSAAIQSAY